MGVCARSWRKEGSRSEEPLPLSLTALKSVGEQVPGVQRKSELPYRVQTQRQNSALWLGDTATKPTGDGLEPSLVSEVDPVRWKGGLSNKSPHGLGLESHQEASAVCLFTVSGKGEPHSGEFVVSSTCVLPGPTWHQCLHPHTVPCTLSPLESFSDNFSSHCSTGARRLSEQRDLQQGGLSLSKILRFETVGSQIP